MVNHRLMMCPGVEHLIRRSVSQWPAAAAAAAAADDDDDEDDAVNDAARTSEYRCGVWQCHV